MPNRQNKKLRELEKQSLRNARLIEDCFSTEAGKHVWGLLLSYYEQKIVPDKPGMVDFRAGQRDVVGYLWEMRKIARKQGLFGEMTIADDVTPAGEEEVPDAEAME